MLPAVYVFSQGKSWPEGRRAWFYHVILSKAAAATTSGSGARAGPPAPGCLRVLAGGEASVIDPASAGPAEYESDSIESLSDSPAGGGCRPRLGKLP